MEDGVDERVRAEGAPRGAEQGHVEWVGRGQKAALWIRIRNGNTSVLLASLVMVSQKILRMLEILLLPLPTTTLAPPVSLRATTIRSHPCRANLIVHIIPFGTIDCTIRPITRTRHSQRGC